MNGPRPTILLLCSRSLSLSLVGAMIGFSAVPQAGLPDGNGGDGGDGGEGGVPALRQRLHDLKPSNPMAYLELGEEVADAACGGVGGNLDLARHLFKLAAALDVPRFGRSGCLALADLAEGVNERRRLLALAWLLSGRVSAVGLADATGPGTPDRIAALAVSEALSHYRRGQGALALAALKEPGAMELLQAHGDVLRGGTARFLADCELYRGRRRPMVSHRDLVTMLRLEAALLSGPARNWSGEILVSGGRPLIEVDPGRLAETLGVDTTRPYYRNGRWVKKKT